MLRDFRNFLLRGNVVDLAVAVVIGAAFGTVIASFVQNILTPLLGLAGVPDFQGWEVAVGDAVMRPGLFLNAVIAFVLVAAAIFFFVVRPITKLMERRKTAPDVDSPTMECPHCLSNIPTGARRCAFCTSEVTASG